MTYSHMRELVIGIDPGSEVSGVCMVSERLGVQFAGVLDNGRVVDRCIELAAGRACYVVIEDMQPYLGRLSPAVIDTCKVIGRFVAALEGSGVFGGVYLVPRNKVKRWVFNTFPDIVGPRISKRMAAIHGQKVKAGGKGLLRDDGTMRAGSFHYVDDRAVISAVKSWWAIPTPKPGKRSPFGLGSHSWQALGVLSCWMDQRRYSIYQ